MQVVGECNLVGDIHGCYETLLALRAKMPKATLVAVGDLVDRGPRSKQVVELFATDKDTVAIMGNHDHILLECATRGHYYDHVDKTWIGCESHGALATVVSYAHNPKIASMDIKTQYFEIAAHLRSTIPSHHIDFLRLMHDYVESSIVDELGETLLATHAPINPSIPFKMFLDIGTHGRGDRSGTSRIWNRGDVRMIEGKFQVHGHLTYRRPKQFLTKGKKWFAAGIDTGGFGYLTGLHWPSKTLYHQELID